MMTHFTTDCKLRPFVRSVNFFLLLWMCILFIPHGVDAQTERELPRMTAHRTSEEIKDRWNSDERLANCRTDPSVILRSNPTKANQRQNRPKCELCMMTKKLYFGFIFFDEMDKIGC